MTRVALSATRMGKHHAAGELKASDRERVLRETIATYDATAAEYAQRFQADALQPYIARFHEFLPPGTPRVLDAGCGHGRDCAAFERLNIDVVGVDLSQGLLRQARNVTTASLVLADLRTLPFTGGSFDGVWSCASLVHLDPQGLEQALREFHRVLQPGGALFVSIRAGVGEEWRNEGAKGRRHFHLYTEADLNRLLRAGGFTVKSLTTEPGVASGLWVNAFAGRRP
jgi:SAM-dependent methyltransferase